MTKRKHIFGLGFFFVVFGVALGVGMYYAGYNDGKKEAPCTPDTPVPTVTPPLDIFQELQNQVSASNISTFLKHLSSVPHMAGTEEDLRQADWLKQHFEDSGLDHVDVIPYTVLLSYPDSNKPNLVYLLDSKGEANFTTTGRQTPLYAPEESDPLAANNFNAYSGTGTAEGGLVYVYYGQESDFDYVAQRGISVAGNIVLARYGASFRGNIADFAEKRGAKGVLLFSDPKDFAQDGRNQIYPDSWWMPGMAVQSGTIMLGNGDPLTPFYPSIDGAYRILESEAKLPSIPVQPIGYDEAEILLQALKEVEEAPAEWQGSLNTKYYLGPDFKEDGWKVKMEVLTSNKLATVYNTIGTLYGSEEPDRYVVVGNHRDAWTLGALDPSSGTAVMMEMARAFGQLKENHDWRPRRSIVFCSWGAEEYGLIGSYEWVEEHAKVLSQRAVAYLNVDIAVEGNYSMRGNAAPLLHNVFVESSKKISNPNPSEVAAGRTTVFDTWIKSFPDAAHPQFPSVRILGSGSDYTAFMHTIGIPSLDIRYTYEEDVGSYPLYHTLYETHHLLANIMDKEFLYHRAVAQLWTEIARNLAESVVLPMDINWYSTYLTETFSDIKTRYNDRIEANGATLKYFEDAVNEFAQATVSYSSILNNLDTSDVLAVRRVNDQLIQLERHFIDPRGLPNRPEYNHIVFAPSASDNYASSSFSGLTDLLEAVGDQSEEERPTEWTQIKQHLSVIAFLIQAAGKSLSDFF